MHPLARVAPARLARARLALLAGALALLGTAPARAQEGSAPALDDDARQALAQLETPEASDPKVAFRLVRSPAWKAVAGELAALVRKAPKEHATHEAAGAVLGKLLDAHPSLDAPLDVLLDLAEHDAPGCRRVGLALLRSTLGRTQPPSVPAALDPRVGAVLETRVQAVFVQIEALAKEQKVEELVPCFEELDELMRIYSRSGREQVKATLAKWDKRLEEWKEIRLAVKLQADIAESNALLKALVRAKQTERWADLRAAYVDLEKLTLAMKQEEREEFHRNADAILARATPIRDQGLALERIVLWKIEVSAIVVDPRPESKNRAVIHVEGGPRIYEEGDALRDREDKKIEGLVVVKISEGSVKLKYLETEFIRELRAP